MSDRKLWDSGPIGPGQSFTMTIETMGQYFYRCGLHPDMRGFVSVVGPDPLAATVTVTSIPAHRAYLPLLARARSEGW